MSNYTVPENYKKSRSQNDAVWDQLTNGPIIQEFDIDTNIDDIVTTFIQNWMTSVQAHNNIMSILNSLVKKYEIHANASNTELYNLPNVILNMYISGQCILQAYDELLLSKQIILYLRDIRKDWSSIEAFVEAPPLEQQLWCESKGIHNSFINNVLDLLNYM